MANKSLKEYIKEDMKQVHLAYAPAEADADAWIQALKDAGISAKKGDGIRDMYAIGGAVGVEIFVAPDDVDKASEIIRGLSGNAAPSPAPAGAARKSVTWLAVCAAMVVLLIIFRAAVMHV